MDTRSHDDHSTVEDAAEPSTRVIGAVAAALGMDPTDCPPLYEVIDPSALDELFQGRPATTGYVHLEYAGFHVTVDSDGGVTLAPAGET